MNRTGSMGSRVGPELISTRNVGLPRDRVIHRSPGLQRSRTTHPTPCRRGPEAPRLSTRCSKSSSCSARRRDRFPAQPINDVPSRQLFKTAAPLFRCTVAPPPAGGGRRPRPAPGDLDQARSPAGLISHRKGQPRQLCAARSMGRWLPRWGTSRRGPGSPRPTHDPVERSPMP